VSSTLWHGRFAGGPSEALQALNDSLPFDQRMFREDIAGSQAHVRMLCDVGLFTEAERDGVLAALDTVEHEIDDLLTDGVVSTSVVVRGILLSGDELLGMVQLSVGSRANLVNDGGLEIDENTSGDVLSGSGLREEGVESIITSSDGLVRGHLSVRLDSVLKAVELPTGVTDLDTGLSYMDRDYFTHLIVLYSCDENKELM